MKNFSIITVLAFLYYTTGEISLRLLEGHNLVSLGIFVPEGIALAFIIFFGKKVWPGIFIGQFILAYSYCVNIYASFEISAVNSMESIIAFILFNRLRFDKNLKSSKDIIGLVLIIVLLLQPFSALLSNAALLLHDIIDIDGYMGSVFSWWFGGVIGQILITPFLLLLFHNYKKFDLT